MTLHCDRAIAARLLGLARDAYLLRIRLPKDSLERNRAFNLQRDLETTAYSIDPTAQVMGEAAEENERISEAVQRLKSAPTLRVIAPEA